MMYGTGMLLTPMQPDTSNGDGAALFSSLPPKGVGLASRCLGCCGGEDEGLISWLLLTFRVSGGAGTQKG